MWKIAPCDPGVIINLCQLILLRGSCLQLEVPAVWHRLDARVICNARLQLRVHRNIVLFGFGMPTAASSVVYNLRAPDMELTWYGQSCFRVTERGMPTVVTDPYDHDSVGFKALKLKGDIVTVSHDAPGHNFVKGVKGSNWEIRGSGEYEIGGVFITGVATNEGKPNQNMVFIVDYEGVTVCHLGDLTSVPSRTQVEAFGTVDVLLVPVGGGNALSAAKAAEVIAMIEPGFVVPMHYKTEGSKLKLSPLKQFLQEMGITGKEKAEDSLKVTPSSVPDETKVVVLNAAQ